MRDFGEVFCTCNESQDEECHGKRDSSQEIDEVVGDLRIGVIFEGEGDHVGEADDTESIEYKNGPDSPLCTRVTH
jgi:hypothetical protein